jgi:hypothetical protein
MIESVLLNFLKIIYQLKLYQNAFSSQCLLRNSMIESVLWDLQTLCIFLISKAE